MKVFGFVGNHPSLICIVPDKQLCNGQSECLYDSLPPQN